MKHFIASYTACGNDFSAMPWQYHRLPRLLTLRMALDHTLRRSASACLRAGFRVSWAE